MTSLPICSLIAGAATAVLGLALGACSETTYGTGTTPGMQTLEDIAGIAVLGGGDKKDPIEYSARPKLVPPPPGTPLPPPGDKTNVAADWPNDPDVADKKFKAEVAARSKPYDDEYQPIAANDPKFRLPPQQQSQQPAAILVDVNQRPDAAAHSTAAQDAQAKKLFADNRGNVAVDANGNPVRRYLTDPPTVYREPDPNAPLEIDNKPAGKKKKWTWPWESQTASVQPAARPATATAIRTSDDGAQSALVSAGS